MDGVTVRRATTWGIHMSCQQRVHRNQYCSVDQSEVENIISHIRIQRMAVFGHTVSDCLPMLHRKLPVITQCRVQQPLPVMCRNQSINQSVIIPLCLRERSYRNQSISHYITIVTAECLCTLLELWFFC